MLKLLGSVMICGACAALGVAAQQALVKRAHTLDAMQCVLQLIESRIRASRTALPEIAAELAESEVREIACLFQGLCRRLRADAGLSFGQLWKLNLQEQAEELGLRAQDCYVLSGAAEYLGCYDIQEQCAGLCQTRERLRLLHARAEGEMQVQGRLYRTCALAFGLLLALVLI